MLFFVLQLLNAVLLLLLLILQDIMSWWNVIDLSKKGYL